MVKTQLLCIQMFIRQTSIDTTHLVETLPCGVEYGHTVSLLLRIVE